MSNLVLVRSSMRTWDYVLLLLAGIGSFVLGWVIAEGGDQIPGLIFQVLGGVCVVASAIGLRYRIRSRQWVRLESDRFTLVDRTGETDYKDSEVRSLALRYKRHFSEGVETSATRTMLIWLAIDNDDVDLEKLTLESTFKTGAGDPLASLIERLSKQVLDRARDLLSSGKTFSGDGWVLERQNLVVAAKPEPLHSPLDSIAMTGVVDKKLCLWQTGNDEVWARINIDSVNAYVLKWLIDERLAERPQDADAKANGELGRVLFERRSSTTTVVILALGTVTLLLLGFGLFVGGLTTNQGNERVQLLLWGIGALAGAIGCVLGMIHCRRAVFRCYQFGLRKNGLLGERTLLYENVEAFTYQSTRHYHNGVYTGTVFVLDFEPNAEHKSQRIRYSATLTQADEELENLRDQVALIIGQRMRSEIDSGRVTTWTPSLTFQGGKLLYRASGFIGRKDPVEIPISQVESFTMDKGQCHLFVKGKPKAAVQQDMHARNFFPGFHCLLSMINRPTSDES